MLMHVDDLARFLRFEADREEQGQHQDDHRANHVPGSPSPGGGLSTAAQVTLIYRDRVPDTSAAGPHSIEEPHGLAIIVSILYAGYEFRRSNTMSSGEADVLLYERVREANRLMIETSNLADILVEARNAPEDLSAAERLRSPAFQHNVFDSRELGRNQHEDGILDEAT